MVVQFCSVRTNLTSAVAQHALDGESTREHVQRLQSRSVRRWLRANARLARGAQRPCKERLQPLAARPSVWRHRCRRERYHQGSGERGQRFSPCHGDNQPTTSSMGDDVARRRQQLGQFACLREIVENALHRPMGEVCPVPHSHARDRPPIIVVCMDREGTS